MNVSEKLRWREDSLRRALDREGIPYRNAFFDVLLAAADRENHRSDAARYRRAYGSSRDRRRSHRY